MAPIASTPEVQEEKPLYKKLFTLAFWQKQNHWLAFLTFLLIFMLGLYLSIHTVDKYSESNGKEYFDDPHEAEYKTMDDHDISYITSLINEGSTFIPTTVPMPETDSNGVATGPANYPNFRFSQNPNSRVVKDYIVSQLPYVFPGDTAKLFALLDDVPNSLAVSFIQNARFKVKSYFWLVGPHTYIEIIFWTIFGVITSILFYIGAAVSNGTGFRPDEVPGHLAKIAYSPFISLIIIFSYNIISSPDNVFDVGASKGTLIVSFLLGFYSSRAMKLLDKLKEVLLPYGDQTTADERMHAADIAKQEAAENTTATVTVDINVNDAQHPDLEELNGHVAQAVVTLTPQAGGNPITLEKTGEDELEGLFTAANIVPGAYTLTGSLATSDGGNYTATQEVQVAEGDNTYTLVLTKTEVSG